MKTKVMMIAAAAMAVMSTMAMADSNSSYRSDMPYYNGGADQSTTHPIRDMDRRYHNEADYRTRGTDDRMVRNDNRFFRDRDPADDNMTAKERVRDDWQDTKQNVRDANAKMTNKMDRAEDRWNSKHPNAKMRHVHHSNPALRGGEADSPGAMDNRDTGHTTGQ